MTGMRTWKNRQHVLRKTVKGIGLGLMAAQIAVVLGIHAVDRVRQARTPGGERDLPTLPPIDVTVGKTQTRTYTDGHSLYQDMLQAINSAQNYIYFESYIIRADKIGQQFKDALYAAADRGVKVFVVYDGFGTLNQNLKFKIFPHHPNLFVRRFPEVRWGILTLNPRNSGRDHRKIIVVDGKEAFVGGFNIGKRFADEWRDTHVRLVGPAISELDRSFTIFWNEFKPKHAPSLPVARLSRWDASIEALFNFPSRLLFPVRGMYLDAIDRARDHIFITTAYFIPDREILDALIAAARRDVHVKVLIPEYSNHILADWVARPKFGRLLNNGIELFLYQHAMNHSKTMTIDGNWSTVGTANIDRLSMLGNFEVNMQIHSEPYAHGMETIFKKDLETSRQLTIDEWSKRDLLTRASESLLRPFEYFV